MQQLEEDYKNEPTSNHERVTLKQKEELMVRAFKRLIGTVAVLLLITGCQAMTGETMGQNIDDGLLHHP